jgi:hypothetical protein
VSFADIRPSLNAVEAHETFLLFQANKKPEDANQPQPNARVFTFVTFFLPSLLLLFNSIKEGLHKVLICFSEI